MSSWNVFACDMRYFLFIHNHIVHISATFGSFVKACYFFQFACFCFPNMLCWPPCFFSTEPHAERVRHATPARLLSGVLHPNNYFESDKCFILTTYKYMLFCEPSTARELSQWKKVLVIQGIYRSILLVFDHHFLFGWIWKPVFTWSKIMATNPPRSPQNVVW